MAGLRFAILGSGSRGNATLIDDGRTRILIDCGFNLGETERRLERLGVAPGSLSAIVVTHEHGDHVRGAGMLARRHGIPVWMTPGTRAALPARIAATMPEPERYDPHTPFAIDGLSLHPLPVPHDAREPSQFVVTDGAHRLGVLSDAGHITQHMVACLSGLDALLLEANHDPDMLAEGPYPAALKLRVGGSLGHLSNHQSAQLLGAVDTSRLRHVVLTHLSEQNNTPERARGVAAEALGCTPDWLGVAYQDDGLAWRAV
ncbi:MBL fold metallo-hydrolase [Algiphilus sp.]|uniref:MBL fold metallo-hydrolase n=1 Tax=Algiphilus sp. TaxID=1872431 RepID=UPI0025BB2AC1|nr:MBL fold metallo-hydrolase [Algiphilus sp.]MCK5768924.1 MBL fold metallo-hydrolase [Algiphilus sp.]